MTHFSEAQEVELPSRLAARFCAIFLFPDAMCALREAASPGAALEPGGLLWRSCIARPALASTLTPVADSRVDGMMVFFEMPSATRYPPNSTWFDSIELPRLELHSGGRLTLLAGRFRTLVAPTRTEPSMIWIDVRLDRGERVVWARRDDRCALLYIVSGSVSIERIECRAGRYATIAGKRRGHSFVRARTRAHVVIVAFGEA